MGIFDFLHKDETSHWKAATVVPLTLNLEEKMLNKFRMGDHKDSIAKFGKPDNKRAYQEGRFDFHENGFFLESCDGEVDSFVVIIAEDKCSADFSPVNLTVIGENGKTLYVTPESTRVELVSQLGLDIAESDVDDYEIIDEIRIDNTILEIEYFLDEKVKRISLYETDE